MIQLVPGIAIVLLAVKVPLSAIDNKIIVGGRPT
jgi:hypothetical protein